VSSSRFSASPSYRFTCTGSSHMNNDSRMSEVQPRGPRAAASPLHPRTASRARAPATSVS
jgi:hypothetical protein